MNRSTVPSASRIANDSGSGVLGTSAPRMLRSQAIESGKPEHIAEKMVEGKIRKFLDEVVLLRQPFIKDDKQQVASLLPQGTTIKSFVRYHLGG